MSSSMDWHPLAAELVAELVAHRLTLPSDVMIEWEARLRQVAADQIGTLSGQMVAIGDELVAGIGRDNAEPSLRQLATLLAALTLRPHVERSGSRRRRMKAALGDVTTCAPAASRGQTLLALLASR